MSDMQRFINSKGNEDFGLQRVLCRDLYLPAISMLILNFWITGLVFMN